MNSDVNETLADNYEKCPSAQWKLSFCLCLVDYSEIKYFTKYFTTKPGECSTEYRAERINMERTTSRRLQGSRGF